MKAMNTDGLLDGRPARHIEAFLDRLRITRYSEVTLGKKRRVLSAFSRWLKSNNVAVAHIDESVIASFMGRLTDAPAARIQFELAVLRLFLAYLRGEAIVRLAAAHDESDITHIHRNYVDYLRQDRGLTKNSVLVYAPFIRDFLDSQDSGDGQISSDAFDASTIRNYLLARSKGKSGEYMRLMAVALRSFCHFLFLRGDTVRDLHDSVPTVSKYRQSSVPTFLTPEQEEALIATVDQSTPTGRRDFAILLLLARLGLRAGEIVALELGDIRWRSAELVIHGAGLHRTARECGPGRSQRRRQDAPGNGVGLQGNPGRHQDALHHRGRSAAGADNSPYAKQSEGSHASRHQGVPIVDHR